jgi:predicted CopG family antitoxin
MPNVRLRNIAISDDNYNSLKDLGKTGDSFNDVIRKLILLQQQQQQQEHCKEHNHFNNQKMLHKRGAGEAID